MRRFLLIAALAWASAPASAQSLGDVIPLSATHCALKEPPPEAGIGATPGGFVMVFPRNTALGNAYTGCKLLWIVDTDRLQRFATLYFVEGRLRTAVAHETRDPAAPLLGACAFPEGRSLMPAAGRQIDDAGCRGFAEDPFYGLRLATWPRTCLTNPEAAVCKADPR